MVAACVKRERKRLSWVPVNSRWLTRRRRQLIKSGFTLQEMDILRLRDVWKWSWSQIGELILERIGPRAAQIYQRVRRRLCNPSRAAIVPPKYRARNSLR